MIAAKRILDQAKAMAGKDCSHPSDVLVRVLCEGHLDVGLRAYYPGFSIRHADGTFTGFEPDIARRIAAFLGVKFAAVVVDAKNRIPVLAGSQIDLVIATMGHTLQRDTQVRFIRPHYYVSQTAIVGPKGVEISDWPDIAGRTVCLSLGSATNLVFIQHHIRVLTFDRPEQLLDVLQFHECAFVVQDDTFFARPLADPDWSAQFDIKFRFAPLPWGMAVAREDTALFAALLDCLSVAFHANGVFLELAKTHGLDPSFLNAERDKWNVAECLTADGLPMASCLARPADNTDPADTSQVAPYAAWFQQKMADWLGVNLDLSLLRNQTSFELLLGGITYTLVLIAGTQISTTIIALGFGRLMTSSFWPLRRGIGALTVVGQVTPLPLLIFFVYVLTGGILRYSGTAALGAAVFAIGLYNGSNAARAIDEAYQTLLRRNLSVGVALSGSSRPPFFRAISLASVQLVAFLINAAKGSPAAGMIGVPDFLNVVTDLTASSRERITMYMVLLVFYASLVSAVILLLSLLRARLVPQDTGQR